MKIAVLFASNRRGGKHGEIRKMISSLDLPYEYDWIELADCDISHCGQEAGAYEVKKKLNKILPDCQIHIVETGGIASVYAGIGGIILAYA